ncbi:methyltransferase [Mycolicibacterium duvalii]|uniref:Polyketide synthesis methyltransferase n=1 Tax=Mycolicibacterium duvalii TaxID=39688 RepID=A0A7I7K6M5_9MYCO|nr:class I SAM-dependent methyltransferase [Mycolicibacterium duvalii]MCV7366215.1 class I SAM-dependent methyltransferase [Mycolicibacterium duvalii]PEG38862.1 methyltransferase [Mycolicibacterium duvalii]BBX19667.1 polyketide synthesis methyltransferase [Mycolicibacterium duvalii]
MSAKVRVDLHGAPVTMLATLHAKALDAEAPTSILHDTWAVEAVERIDYDWTATSMTRRNAPSVTLRSAYFDGWTRQFLAAHPEAVVVHLGCGLDSRFWRTEPGPGVEWFDIDYPEVADLRRKVYPPAPGNHIIAASVTDPGLLAQIPDDRPTLVLAEGLTMYLTRDDGLRLFGGVVDRFGGGEIQFDAFSRFGIATQWGNAVVRRSGATLSWGVDRPDDILAAVPNTRLLQWVPVFQREVFAPAPPRYRHLAAMLNRVPLLRTVAQFHRYAF